MKGTYLYGSIRTIKLENRKLELFPHRHDQPRNQKTFSLPADADADEDAGSDEGDAEDGHADDNPWKQDKRKGLSKRNITTSQ